MGQSLFINFDTNDLKSSSVASASDLRNRRFTQFVAGDSLELDLFLVGTAGLLNIQDYAEVRLGLGQLDARPDSGTYKIGSNTPLAYNHSAAQLEAIIDSDVADATVTQLTNFVFKVQFNSTGSQTIPSIDSRLLSPTSTVSVTKLATGDATTKETWLWRLYQNPVAFTSSFSNISGQGIRGILSLATAGVYDLLGTSNQRTTNLELELTDASGNVRTIMQAEVKLRGEVIGHNFSGSIPVSPSIPPSATTFLESFPNPDIVGNLTVDGTLQTSTISSEDNSNLLIKTNDDNVDSITIQTGDGYISGSAAGNINIKAGGGSGGGNIDFFNAGFNSARIGDAGSFLAGGVGTPTLFVTKSSGGSSTKNSVSIGTGDFPQATLDVNGDLKFRDFTSTSRSSGASALNPVQNYQPATDDTLANLCVDSSGNVVRGSQEATWTFDNTQLNALTATRINLLSSPGADKCVVVEETNWLVQVDLTEAYQATNVKLICEMLGVNENSVATQITAANMNQIAQILKTANTNSFGLYHRDVPDLARIYRFDVPMTIRATNGAGATNVFPDNFVSVKLKIKYRVFDKDTF
jgi:hypothetical protein